MPCGCCSFFIVHFRAVYKNSPEGSNKTRLRKLIDKTIMEAKDFDDFIERLKSANIEIGYGNSKKYGTVTKYKFPEEKNFHRGYSLGKFYTDDNIKKRITRHSAYLESQKAKQEERKAKKKATIRNTTPLSTPTTMPYLPWNSAELTQRK